MQIITRSQRQEELNMKILIDNGHGVETAGKQSPDGLFREYRFNREMAATVVEELRKRGYDAERIVPEEEDVSLAERCRRVNAWCSKLGAENVCLVSIHVNAAANGGWQKAQGWSAYTSKGQTQGDKLATALYAVAEKVFSGRKIRKDNTDGDPDLEEGFYILKHTNCAACLTENFFQDNKLDVSYLFSLEGRKAVIQCHVEGIINYVNSLKQ